jgi:hypothetical protein
MNVIGDPIDERGPIETKKKNIPSTERHPLSLNRDQVLNV